MSGLKDGDYTIQMGEMKSYQIVGVQVGDPGPAEYIKIEAPEDIVSLLVCVQRRRGACYGIKSMFPDKRHTNRIPFHSQWRFKKLDNGHYTISVYRQDSPDLKISKVYNNYPVVSVSGSPAEWQLVPAGDAGFYASVIGRISSHMLLLTFNLKYARIVVPSSSSHTKGWTAPSADSKSNIVCRIYFTKHRLIPTLITPQVTLENIDTTQPPLSQKWYIAISY